MKMKLLLTALLLLSSTLILAQRGKDTNRVVVNLDTIFNTYTSLSIDATAGTSSISVVNNSMIGGVFANPLNQGDLIMIIQMYGADIDNDMSTYSATYPFTYPVGHIGDWKDNPQLWGRVTNYHQAGKFEYVEVLSVSGSNTINLNCALSNSYLAAKKVQIVRVPRFNNLKLNNGSSITAPAWDGTTGGIVALEINADLTMVGSAKIETNGKGFRGGLANVTSLTDVNTADNANGSSYLASNSSDYGARKGESIFGYLTEMNTALCNFGRGAIANGGGGGGYQNSGGGGGSNVNTTLNYTGKGNPAVAYNAAWNLEIPGFGASTSTGGGRGGYSYSTSNQDATLVGPNNTQWNGSARKSNGGLGGHPIDYDATRLFFGGGGGAGNQDQNQAGSGGNGGGLIYLTIYGNTIGTGTIESNGANGQKTNPLNQATSAGTPKKGNDGAGGGGAGGTIVIRNNSSIPNTITLNAKGGNGGNHDLSLNTAFVASEGSGPGGSGSGGFIAYTLGTPTVNLNAGIQGTTNSAQLTEFPPNGATNGSAGYTTAGPAYFNLIPNGQSACVTPLSASVSVTVVGTPAGSIEWYTTQYGGASFHTGTSYNTPPLNANTTYWVGVCPGTFRVPVTVTVGATPVISGTAVVTDATCLVPGAITGLTASGGQAPLTYSWNGVSYSSLDANNLAAGTYNGIITDANGCSTNVGPYVVGGSGGPSIDATNVFVQDQSCDGTMGSITGITTNGSGLTYSWDNGGGNSIFANNLTAGNYTLSVTDGNGCVSTAGPYTVGSIAGPSINASNPVIQNETCALNDGSITGITATGNNLNYLWNGNFSVGPDLTGASAGNYSLQIIDNNGCMATAGPFVIAGAQLPVINANNVVVTSTTCGLNTGSIAGITVSGGTPNYSYAWTNTAQTTLDINNLVAGNYTLTVTDQNGCSVNAGPFNVNNLNGPVINETNVQVTQLDCNGTLGAITGITASGNGLTYTWTNGMSTLNLTNLPAGNYTLMVTDVNGCVDYSSVYTINPLNGVVIDLVNLSVVKDTCGKGVGSINGITVTGGTPGYTYSWNNSPALNTLDLTNLAVGGYNLVVTDANGCSSTTSILVNEVAASTIDDVNLVVTQPTCSTFGAINGLVANGNGGYVYLWTPTNASSLNISNLNPGSYQLQMTDAFGCVTQYGPIDLISPSGPTAAFNFAPAQPGVNELVNFTNASSGNVVSSEWIIDGLISTNTNASYAFLAEGVYPVQLIVEDNNGCTDTTVQWINVFNTMGVPNVITPNGDHQNDYFVVKGLKLNTSLLIINRWGNVVFRTDNYQNNWNGVNQNGKDLDEGVYFYKMISPSGDRTEGFIHLQR